MRISFTLLDQSTNSEDGEEEFFSHYVYKSSALQQKPNGPVEYRAYNSNDMTMPAKHLCLDFKSPQAEQRFKEQFENVGSKHDRVESSSLFRA